MNPFRRLRRLWVWFLRRQSDYLTRQSKRWLLRLGRTSDLIHPKHLYGVKSPWYEGYLDRGVSFLDVGSGVGTACLVAASKGAARVVGIEGSEESLRISRARAEAEGTQIEFVKADLEEAQFPLPDASFDVVLFNDVIEHLDNRVAVLREIRRVLTDEGVLLVAAPNGYAPWKRLQADCGLFHYDDRDHKIEYTRESLRAELATGGFACDDNWEAIVLSTPMKGLCDFSAVFSPRLYRRLARWKAESARRNPDRSTGWRLKAQKAKP